MPVVQYKPLPVAAFLKPDGSPMERPTTPAGCIDIQALSSAPPPPPLGTLRLYLDANTGQLCVLGADGTITILALLS